MRGNRFLACTPTRLVLDPTLSIFEEMMTAPRGKIPLGYQPIAERLPPQVRRGLLCLGLTPPSGMERRYQQSFTRMMELIGMMYRAGIAMEDGTDSMAGFALHRELELDVQAGGLARTWQTGRPRAGKW